MRPPPRGSSRKVPRPCRMNHHSRFRGLSLVPLPNQPVVKGPERLERLVPGPAGRGRAGRAQAAQAVLGVHLVGGQAEVALRDRADEPRPAGVRHEVPPVQRQRVVEVVPVRVLGHLAVAVAVPVQVEQARHVHDLEPEHRHVQPDPVLRLAGRQAQVQGDGVLDSRRCPGPCRRRTAPPGPSRRSPGRGTGGTARGPRPRPAAGRRWGRRNRPVPCSPRSRRRCCRPRPGRRRSRTAGSAYGRGERPGRPAGPG